MSDNGDQCLHGTQLNIVSDAVSYRARHHLLLGWWSIKDAGWLAFDSLTTICCLPPAGFSRVHSVCVCVAVGLLALLAQSCQCLEQISCAADPQERPSCDRLHSRAAQQCT